MAGNLHQRPEQGAAGTCPRRSGPATCSPTATGSSTCSTRAGGARFWRAHDRVLARHVAVHVIDADDDARRRPARGRPQLGAPCTDRRLLRVLDADQHDGLCFVVNEWGAGTSLDILLAGEGPLAPRRAAWIVEEVADGDRRRPPGRASAHGRLVPENVLLDHTRLGPGDRASRVDAALHGLPPGRRSRRRRPTSAGCSTPRSPAGGPASRPRWSPRAPVEAGRVLRPRQVRAGIPRPLDTLCDAGRSTRRWAAAAPGRRTTCTTARGIADYLRDFVGDPPGWPSPTRSAAGAAARARPGPPRRGPDGRPGRRRAERARPVPTSPSPTRAVTDRPSPTPEPPTRRPGRRRAADRGRDCRSSTTTTTTWLADRAGRAGPRHRRRSRSPPARPLFAPDPPAGHGPRRRPGRAAGPDDRPERDGTGSRSSGPGRRATGHLHRHASGSVAGRRGRRGAPGAAGCGWPWSSPPRRSCCCGIVVVAKLGRGRRARPTTRRTTTAAQRAAAHRRRRPRSPAWSPTTSTRRATRPRRTPTWRPPRSTATRRPRGAP